MREITEESIAEWVVTQVLDNCAAVSISVGVVQFFGSRVGESTQEQRLNAVAPGGVDDSFVSENRVSRTIGGAEHSQDKYNNECRIELFPNRPHVAKQV